MTVTFWRMIVTFWRLSAPLKRNNCVAKIDSILFLLSDALSQQYPSRPVLLSAWPRICRKESFRSGSCTCVLGTSGTWQVWGGWQVTVMAKKKVKVDPFLILFANFFGGELDVLEIILQCSPQRKALDLLRLHAQLTVSDSPYEIIWTLHTTVETRVVTRRVGGFLSWPPLQTVR